MVKSSIQLFDKHRVVEGVGNVSGPSLFPAQEVQQHLLDATSTPGENDSGGASPHPDVGGLALASSRTLMVGGP